MIKTLPILRIRRRIDRAAPFRAVAVFPLEQLADIARLVMMPALFSRAPIVNIILSYFYWIGLIFSRQRSDSRVH